jgi:hypothetical protein
MGGRVAPFVSMRALEHQLQPLQGDAGFPVHASAKNQEIEQGEPGIRHLVAQIASEDGVDTLGREQIRDYRLPLRPGGLDAPAMRAFRLVTRHVARPRRPPATNSSTISSPRRSGWFDDPLTEIEAGCQTGQFAGVVT